MIHYIVNVEVAVFDHGRYLMMVRSVQESHAPGTLSFPGGKVEDAGEQADILEETARREVLEEVGVTLGALAYVESKSFLIEDEGVVVDLVFLARYGSGIPTPGDPIEVEFAAWMTFDEIVDHPKTPTWIVDSIIKVEARRWE